MTTWQGAVTRSSNRLGPPFALIAGFGLAIAWGVLFGLLSRLTILLGIIGSFGTGFMIAAMVLAPFQRVSRSWALLWFPYACLCTALSTLLIILLPFVWITLAKDPSATLFDAIRLSWVFYRSVVGHFGSSLIITIIGACSAVVGYLGRLRGLRIVGRYPR